MTVAGLLRFAARVRGYGRAELARRIERAVGLTHLESVSLQPIETLSKGYKRRLGLALALLHDPPVLVLDEPTDGLDPNQKHEVRDLIRAMAPQKATVISTHILEEVDAICTRAIIIDRGRIVADATPVELRARHPSGRLDDVFRVLTGGDDPMELDQASRLARARPGHQSPIGSANRPWRPDSRVKPGHDGEHGANISK
jgi:ABC-2 type transport system ATP-binding protein